MSNNFYQVIDHLAPELVMVEDVILDPTTNKTPVKVTKILLDDDLRPNEYTFVHLFGRFTVPRNQPVTLVDATKPLR